MNHLLDTPMPTLSEVYAFLRRHYKHDRFEGRNDTTWGKEYSQHVAECVHDDLRRHGCSLISRHESKTGEVVKFDRALGKKAAEAEIGTPTLFDVTGTEAA